MFDAERVKAGESVRRVKKLARKTNTTCWFEPAQGKGSHGCLFFGDRLTTLQDLMRELPTGTLHAMLKQLGLTLKDIE